MANIISLSIGDRMQRDLERLRRQEGYAGRSEALRAGLRLLLAEKKQQEGLRGIKDAALIVVHDDSFSPAVSQVRHHFEHIIKTQIHNHLESHKCLEIFVLKGDAREIVGITRAFARLKGMDMAKLFVL